MEGGAERRATEVDLSALCSLGSTGSPLSSTPTTGIYSQGQRGPSGLRDLGAGPILAGAFVLGHPGCPVRARRNEVSRACQRGARLDRGRQRSDGVWANWVLVPNALPSDAAVLLGRRRWQPSGTTAISTPMPALAPRRWIRDQRTRRVGNLGALTPRIKPQRSAPWLCRRSNQGRRRAGRGEDSLGRRSRISWAVKALCRVVGRPRGVAFDDTLKDRSTRDPQKCLKRGSSHEIIRGGPNVPRTLSGKKLDRFPVKKLLLGQDPEKVVTKISSGQSEQL